MSVISQPTEPTQNPCWVLTYKALKKGVGLILREWRKGANGVWLPTEKPNEHPRSLYVALERADWVGKLPKQARGRRSYTPENLARVRALLEQGVTSPSRIAAELGLPRTSVRHLIAATTRDGHTP